MAENNENKNLFESFIPQLKEFIKSETVFGEPFTAGEVTLIPVNSVKVGFGFGGGKLTEKGQSAGEGGGGGVLMTPIAFVVVKGGEVTIHSLTGGTIENVVEKVPDLLDKVVNLFKPKQPTP